MTRMESDLVAVRQLTEEVAAAGPEASLARAWYRIGERQRPRRRLPRRLVPIASALAVTLAVGVGALLLRGGGTPVALPGNDPTVPVAQAWAELERAGRSAQPASIVDGQVLYVHTQAVGAAVTIDGTPWTMIDESSTAWYDPATMRLLKLTPARDGVPQGPNARVVPPDLDDATPAWVASWPTDPDALRQFLLDAAAPSAGDWAVRHRIWDGVSHVLATTDLVLPPAVRVALYQVLSEESGEVATHVTVAGRSLLAITRVERTDGQQLLFDPATGRCVGHRSIFVGQDPGAPADGVMSWAVWDQAVVPAVGATP
jgi:hypothetical protein